MIVSLEKKVHITLWLLSNHSISFRATSDLFGLSKGTAHMIFLEITRAIAELRHMYIRWPNAGQCNRNGAEVHERFGIPGVIGCIDGCHIPIKAPKENPVDFYNRKMFHSVVLQGVCDNSLKFTDIYIGMTGRVHDARIFRNSPLYHHIDNGLINDEQHLLADSAYGLSVNVLTPYRNNGHLTRGQIRFNRKHAGARSAIERAFGMLKGKFRRLKFLDVELLDYLPIIIGRYA